MKVTYLTNACVIVEHNGTRVLCDPWLTDGAYYGSWFHWPPPDFTDDDIRDIDYLYLSHIHPDHFDRQFLSTFDKSVPVIICEYEEKYFRRQLEGLGFTRIIELPNNSSIELGDDFGFEMYAADDCNADIFSLVYKCPPLKNYTRTRQIDSLCVFTGGGRTVVNCVDIPAGMAQISLQLIRRKHRHIDLALVPYAGAGPYPQSYIMSKEEMEGLRHNVAIGYLSYTTLQMLKFLDPAFYMPFAGGYLLGGKNHWKNAYKGTVEIGDLNLDLVPLVQRQGLRGKMVTLDRRGSFDLMDGRYSSAKPIDVPGRDAYIKDVLSKKLYDYELDPEVQGDLRCEFAAAVPSLQKAQVSYGYKSDWRVYFADDKNGALYSYDFSDGSATFGGEVDGSRPYLFISIDPRLLRRMLTRKANWNNIEVGSLAELKTHGVGNDTHAPMIHHLLPYLGAAPGAA